MKPLPYVVTKALAMQAKGKKREEGGGWATGNVCLSFSFKFFLPVIACRVLGQSFHANAKRLRWRAQAAVRLSVDGSMEILEAWSLNPTGSGFSVVAHSKGRHGVSLLVGASIFAVDAAIHVIATYTRAFPSAKAPPLSTCPYSVFQGQNQECLG